MTTVEQENNPPNGAAAPAPKGLSLRKNFSWTFAGNVIYAACQWGILVVLAKLGSPEMVGQFALGLAVTAPVIMFSQLQLRGVQATDAKREYQFGDYLALRLITTALALLVIGGIVAASGYKRETALVVLIVGVMKAVDALSDVYYGLWQQHERMDGIAQALVLNGVVSTTALAAIMATTHNIVLATLGSAAGSATAFLFTLARNRRLPLAHGPAARPTWQPTLLWRLTRLALPLGIVMLLISLNLNVPRYFIQHYLGESELGIFAAITSIFVAGTTVVLALGQSASPILARFYGRRDRQAFARLTFQLVAAGTVVSVTGLLVVTSVGPEILQVLFGDAYSHRNPVFLWAMVAAGISYVTSLMGYGLTAARRFNVQVGIFSCVLLATTLGSRLLVPHLGLEGAAISSAIAATLQLLLCSLAICACIRRIQS